MFFTCLGQTHDKHSTSYLMTVIFYISLKKTHFNYMHENISLYRSCNMSYEAHGNM